MLDLLLKDKRKRKGRERPKVELVQPITPSKKVVIDGKEITVKEIKQVTEDAIVVEDLNGNIKVIPLKKGEGDVSHPRAVLL